MELNRKELINCMGSFEDEKQLVTNEDENTILLKKIEKVLEHIKYRDSVLVRGSSDDCYLTYRQIATFLASVRELDNDNIYNSYNELMDFVHDYGRMQRPVLVAPEVDMLIAQLERIANKIKSIKDNKNTIYFQKDYMNNMNLKKDAKRYFEFGKNILTNILEKYLDLKNIQGEERKKYYVCYPFYLKENCDKARVMYCPIYVSSDGIFANYIECVGITIENNNSLNVEINVVNNIEEYIDLEKNVSEISLEKNNTIVRMFGAICEIMEEYNKYNLANSDNARVQGDVNGIDEKITQLITEYARKSKSIEKYRKIKKREFSQKIKDFPLFRFYFPEDIGEQIRVSPNVFEIKKDNKQILRVSITDCDMDESYLKVDSKAWIEKNKKESEMKEIIYRQESINDITLEVYVLGYIKRNDVPYKIYKMGYVDGYRISISGWLEADIENIIDYAFENIQVDNIKNEKEEIDFGILGKYPYEELFNNIDEENEDALKEFLGRFFDCFNENIEKINYDLFLKIYNSLENTRYPLWEYDEFYKIIKKELLPQDFEIWDDRRKSDFIYQKVYEINVNTVDNSKKGFASKVLNFKEQKPYFRMNRLKKDIKITNVFMEMNSDEIEIEFEGVCHFFNAYVRLKYNQSLKEFEVVEFSAS